MHQRAPHIGAIMTIDNPCLGAANLANALHQTPQLGVGQDQGLEIVGVDLGAGNRSEDLAETGDDALLR